MINKGGIFFMKQAINPIIYSDFPDPDVICVNNAFYMVSTTMHFMPCCVILKSYNLVDWEIINYVNPFHDENQSTKLQDNNGIYAKGMWAACIRYHNGLFYILFIANDTGKTYLFTSDDINGEWKKSEIQGFYHDASLLFDDDKRVFIVHGNSEIHLTELKSDLSGPKKDGINKIIIRDDKNKVNLGYEGSHIYKINGNYYIFLIHWPKNNFRTQACFMAKEIDGQWSGKDVLCSDLDNWNNGLAQGGIVQTPNKKWYAILFQDHGAIGRIPVLIPVNWQDDFPVFESSQEKIKTFQVEDFNPSYKYEPLFTNDFTYLDKNGNEKLKLQWQFNHIPETLFVKLKNNQFEITTSSICKNLCLAQNTLTQRTFGPKCFAEVQVDFSQINDGDFTGIGVLQGDYAFIAATKINGKNQIVIATRKSEQELYKIGQVDKDEVQIIWQTQIQENKIIFRENFDFSLNADFVDFEYKNISSENWNKIDFKKKLKFGLDHFTGARIALFNYSTKIIGGKSIFSNFKFIKE